MNNNIPKYARHIAFLLIVAGSFSSCEKEDMSPEKFRLVKVLYYERSADTQPKDGVEYTYDSAGNMVKESFFDYKANTVYRYREFEYSGNKKIKMKVFNEADNFEMSRYIDYIYDNDRLITEEINNGAGLFLCSMNYEYIGGNMVREYYFEPDYGISDEVIYSFDSQNRLILEEYETSKVTDNKYIKHIFDSNDRKGKLEYYNLNWELIKTVEMIYNGRSKLPVKDIHYDKNGVQTAEYQHYYDKRGNLTETRLVDGCSLFKRRIDGGLLIEEILYAVGKPGCPEDETARYIYEKQ